MLHKIYIVQPDNSSCALKKEFVQGNVDSIYGIYFPAVNKLFGFNNI